MKVKDLVWVALMFAVVGASFWAASRRSHSAAPPTSINGSAVTIEPLAGTDLQRVALTARAAERLGIETVPIRQTESGPKANGARTGAGLASPAATTAWTSVPYSAVLYDASGQTWVYTSPEPLVFARSPIQIDHIDGDQAVLAEGPPPGTAVVAVGGAELFGAELEVGRKISN
jgi:hypothetical protein